MFNRMRSQPIPPAGVVIASGGNAGIAVACAAQALGVRCEVFVPEVCSPAKRAKLAQLGAHVTVGGSGYAEALQASLQRQRESGALLMHAYDQPEVVAGAGTLAAEVEDEAGLPDRALVSVGGGGLIAGIAAWFESRCRVEALEPVLAPTLHRARAAGRPVDVESPASPPIRSAHGASARSRGASAQQHVAATHVLDDAAIRAAQLALWTELRLAVEPAAALGLAALTTPHRRARARREGAAGDLRREPEPGLASSRERASASTCICVDSEWRAGGRPGRAARLTCGASSASARSPRSARAQTLAWASSYYLPAMLAAPMARDLGVSTPTVFAAFSVALSSRRCSGRTPAARSTAGAAGRCCRHQRRVRARPRRARAARRARRDCSPPGSCSASAWAAACTRRRSRRWCGSTARDSRNAITGITLIAGFASTVGWPLSALLEAQFGWRGACFAWAALHLVLGLPLNLLLPQRRRAAARRRRRRPTPTAAERGAGSAGARARLARSRSCSRRPGSSARRWRRTCRGCSRRAARRWRSAVAVGALVGPAQVGGAAARVRRAAPRPSAAVGAPRRADAPGRRGRARRSSARRRRRCSRCCTAPATAS